MFIFINYKENKTGQVKKQVQDVRPLAYPVNGFGLYGMYKKNEGRHKRGYKWMDGQVWRPLFLPVFVQRRSYQQNKLEHQKSVQYMDYHVSQMVISRPEPRGFVV